MFLGVVLRCQGLLLDGPKNRLQTAKARAAKENNGNEHSWARKKVILLLFTLILGKF